MLIQAHIRYRGSVISLKIFASAFWEMLNGQTLVLSLQVRVLENLVSSVAISMPPDPLIYYFFYLFSIVPRSHCPLCLARRAEVGSRTSKFDWYTGVPVSAHGRAHPSCLWRCALETRGGEASRGKERVFRVHLGTIIVHGSQLIGELIMQLVYIFVNPSYGLPLDVTFPLIYLLN